MLELKPWTLPLIVAAILVPAIAGFALAGPPLGLGLGFLTAFAVALFAIRQRPQGPIETAGASDLRRHVLVVVTRELDDPGAIERIKEEGELGEAEGTTEVLVLAPARSKLLDRWATDVRPARAEAQRKLVISIASLGKAGVVAGAALGDEDVIQAVEDELRRFPATEVILVTGTPESDPAAERAAAALRERLRQPLSRIVV